MELALWFHYMAESARCFLCTLLGRVLRTACCELHKRNALGRWEILGCTTGVGGTRLEWARVLDHYVGATCGAADEKGENFAISLK